jgi:hypothetical protein
MLAKWYSCALECAEKGRNETVGELNAEKRKAEVVGDVSEVLWRLLSG